MNTQNELHIQTVNNIKQLQDLEKKLHTNLEAASKNNEFDSSQLDLIKQVNFISDSRIAMFEQLRGIKRLLNSELSAETADLNDKIEMISLVENELNNSKKKIKYY